MYDNRFVVALKHNGKVLREFGDIVYLPFGEEYSIYLKNLNNRRAQVSVSIDGSDVGDGSTFIINANSEMEIKRYIKNGNLTNGNAFKFIERTSAVEDHRGAKIDDGILRVEFWYEQELKLNNILSTTRPEYYPKSTLARGMCTNSTLDSMVISSSVANDVGITVPGSNVSQEFRTVNNFKSEMTSDIIILRLVGETVDNVEVRKPVTVSVKPECVTCGKKSKAKSKFCSRCGTALAIVT